MTAHPDIDPVLSGKPGDRVPPPGREAFTDPMLNAWLDSPAGQAMIMMHGSRAQAAAALEQAGAADRSWRRQQAIAWTAQHPDRFPSVEDAMNAIPDPAGGGGAWLDAPDKKTGVADMAAAARQADLSRPWFAVPAWPDATVRGYSVGPDGQMHPIDTRAAYQRRDAE